MASDLNSISLSNLKKILIYITIHSLIPLLQSLSLRYPTAFTLKDKNIFVIHSLGIDICDPLYTTNTQKIVFTSTPSKSDLSKISISKYENGDFIILIKSQIYLFDGYGQRIASSSLPSTLNANYFSLTADDIVHQDGIDYYFFLLGYIYKTSKKLNLYYYYLNSQTQSITTYRSMLNYADNIRNT